ncbi:MAG TPA: hypothetical protein VKD70_04630 [Candidatus Acidoferrum sp.]|nr:hypothetical protein [Candidatus Acidoferrum sp.]
MTLLVLYLLASLDGALCGFRSSMGRYPYIHKIRFYAMAMLRGVLAAQIASCLSLFALFATVSASSDKALLRQDLEASAARMLLIFLPYAALVLLNLALRLVPSTDLRSGTSVVFLGPLTFLRPFVMIAGVLFGIWHAQLRATILLGLFVLVLMLSLEFALNIYNARIQERRIRLLV